LALDEKNIPIWTPPVDVKEQGQFLKSVEIFSSAVVMHMGDGIPIRLTD